MIYRSDIKEGELLPNRKVHIPSLEKGKIGFEESLRQQGDIKQLGGDVPIEALALGRLELEFTNEFEPTELPDWSQWTANRMVESNTGELFWDYQQEGEGYFTVNTDGTKAIAGFTDGKKFELGDVTLQTDNPFAIVYLTSLEKGKSIAEADSLLLTTMARARNTGMVYAYGEDETRLDAVGKAPLKVEPVDVQVGLKAGRIKKVIPLDHDGRLSDKTIRAIRGSVEIDGAAHETIWYLIVK